MNIILLSWHDVGRHLGCFGRRDVRSPHLDGLAADGVKFDNYFCTYSMCSPSRGSMLTGRWPHVNGLMGLVNRGWDLPKTERTLGNYLKDAGYHTRLFGFQHERANPADFGFDDFWVESTQCYDVAPKVVEFLKGWTDTKTPFFARVGFRQVHRPWHDFPVTDISDVDPLPYLPDSKPLREQLSQLHGCIELADRSVGDILNALKETGLEQDTLVIFTTDHGIGFPRAKGTLFDPGIETALVMRLPGVLSAGKTHSQLLSNVDLLPTVLDLAGVEADLSHINGRSFGPLFEGHEGPVNDRIYAERSWSVFYDPKRCLRTDRYKYILNFEYVNRTMGFGGADILQSDLPPHLPPSLHASITPEQLYDLESDPTEQDNLVERTDAMPLLNEMRGHLRTWMEDTNDPLLEGPIVSPNYRKVIDAMFRGDFPETPLPFGR